MIIAEYFFPGMKLEIPPAENGEDREIQSRIEHIASCVDEAASALNSYYYWSSMASGSKSPEEIEDDVQARSDISRKLGYNAGDIHNKDTFFKRPYEEDKLFYVEKWKQGAIPESYARQNMLINADAFLYSIDKYSKILKSLDEDFHALIGEIVEEHLKSLEGEVPSVRDIRNSAQHVEDRLRQLMGPGKKKQIDLKPIVNEFFNAPNGGILLVRTIINNSLCYTLRDGSTGELELSENTMGKLVDNFQSFINSFEWDGFYTYHPK